MIFDTKEEMPKFTVTADEKARKEEVLWSNREDTMREAVGELKPDGVTYFVTNGAWSMYELLHYLIKQTGPAAVDAFTWNLSMSAANTIIRLREQGYITSFRFLINSIMQRFMMEAISVLQRHCEKIILFPNHAKGFLLKNDQWTVSVLSSANFSNNPQIEGGVISCNPAVYKMHRRWLDPLMEKKELLASARVEPRDLPPEKERKDVPTLYLIRGLPGSGKTTLAQGIADVVCENDDFFTELDGSYHFQPSELEYAKASCLGKCRLAMEQGVTRIAVSNTFVHEEGLKPYQELAAKYGYVCHVMTVENRQRTENIHGVKWDAVERMKKNFRVRL